MIEFAIDLARQAGALVRDSQILGPSDVRSKGLGADLVTEVDLRSEQLIVDAIRRRYPDHAIYAEEAGGQLPASELVWTVDPLDGTINFAHGVTIFCVSIGLVSHDRVILGVTYDPIRDEAYWAERGRGAWCNERSLRVSSTAELGQSLLATGFAQDWLRTEDSNLPEFAHFTTQTRGVRWFGSAALNMAWVAAGRLDGYWEKHLQAWDWTVGALLIEEAGGRVTTLAGQPWRPGHGNLLASNGLQSLHQALLDGLASVEAKRDVRSV